MVSKHRSTQAEEAGRKAMTVRTRFYTVMLAMILVASPVFAQSGDTASVTLPPTSGDVKSDMPAATTGTAPLDTSLPSGTGTTGTSGVTMAEAERNNTRSTIPWVILLAVAIAVFIVFKRRRRAR